MWLIKEKAMTTISVRLPDELNHRLDDLATEMDRKKSYIIRKALEEFLEEKEEYLIALSRLARNEKEYSLEEAEKALGLEN
tara:strand:- start:70 stop:312 length:243 start_codon:yes stop_codon:yes gene_type:complete